MLFQIQQQWHQEITTKDKKDDSTKGGTLGSGADAAQNLKIIVVIMTKQQVDQIIL